MKIGLIDVDSHNFPNLCLMKLSAYHKAKGHVTHSEAGEGLIFYGNVILPFIDRFPQNTELYRVMTTKPGEVSA